MVSNLKVWKDKPSSADVEQHVRNFFARLRSGDIDGAGSMVDHEYNDWEESLFTTWEDHVLVHQIVADKTFEGGAWRDTGWLRDLEVGQFRWDGDEYRCPGLHVEFIYRGVPSGYEGEFRVQEGDAGFVVTRVAFHM